MSSRRNRKLSLVATLKDETRLQGWLCQMASWGLHRDESRPTMGRLERRRHQDVRLAGEIKALEDLLLNIQA